MFVLVYFKIGKLIDELFVIELSRTFDNPKMVTFDEIQKSKRI